MNRQLQQDQPPQGQRPLQVPPPADPFLGLSANRQLEGQMTLNPEGPPLRREEPMPLAPSPAEHSYLRSTSDRRGRAVRQIDRLGRAIQVWGAEPQADPLCSQDLWLVR